MQHSIRELKIKLKIDRNKKSQGIYFIYFTQAFGSRRVHPLVPKLIARIRGFPLKTNLLRNVKDESNAFCTTKQIESRKTKAAFANSRDTLEKHSYDIALMHSTQDTAATATEHIKE